MGQDGLTESLKIAHDGPKMAQDGAKMAPRWPKIAPRWPQMAQIAPTWLQLGSKLAQLELLGGSWGAPGSPGRLQKSGGSDPSAAAA